MPAKTEVKTEEEGPRTAVGVMARQGEGEVAEELEQLVVFQLGGEEYGVAIGEVREIVKMTDITPIPNSPEFIQGIINLRGKIVVVIDLEKRFGLIRSKEAQAAWKHIMIAEMPGGTFGVMVDEVTEVLRIPVKNIREAPSIIAEKIHTDYLKGVGIMEERLIILLDVKKVLSEKELIGLSELAEMNRSKVIKKEVKEEKKPEITEEKVEELAKEKTHLKVEEKITEEIKKIKEGKPAEKKATEEIKKAKEAAPTESKTKPAEAK